MNLFDILMVEKRSFAKWSAIQITFEKQPSTCP